MVLIVVVLVVVVFSLQKSNKNDLKPWK